MPGIAGFITPQIADHQRAMLDGMVACMKNEPFYNSGTCIEESLGAYGGWVCHKGAYADCLPIWNETRDIALLFAGEHYADSDENTRLAANHRFSADDASSLVHLYEEYGSRFFEMLNGTFSGVLIDKRENKVILFNDRYGLGRMYYHQSPDGLYFASEAKAILRVLPHLRKLDMRGLGELMICGCTLQNRTLFPDISLLPAGSVWTIPRGGEVRKETYFDRTSWENQSPLPPEEYYEALKATFNRILPRYFAGRQRTALSLTGGLDSRMIIAGLRRSPGELPCFTFGGMYRDSEDVRVARQIAGLCRQPHSIITVDEKFLPHFPKLAERCVYLTDGTMDVSGSVGLYVNRMSRDLAPVRMTGNYGSEILRNNVVLKAWRIPSSAFSEEFRPFLKQAIDTFGTERRSCGTLSFIGFKQMPWHHYARFAEEQSQLTIRAPYLDNELVPLAYRAPAGLLLNKQLSYRYTTDMLPALVGAPTDRGLLKRPPIVPEKIYDFYKELRPKAEYYFDYGMPQWLAKADRLLSPLHLERFFLGQQKYYHFRIWYRHQLAPFLESVLLDPSALSRSYIDKGTVQQMVRAHVTGSGNYTTMIHKLLTAEMIERHLIHMQ
jgi:asparagine synthase (glutamine-hydrolysing)